MKILLTGGTGFVGSSIREELSKKHSVTSISRREGVDLSKGTLGEHKEIDNFDIMIHAAANVGSVKRVSELASEIIDSNLRINLNAYKTAVECNIKRIININASCIYPAGSEIQDENKLFIGRTHDSSEAFSAAKKLLIHLGMAYRKQNNILSNSLILPGVYGPGDYTDPELTHAMNALIIKSILFKYKKEPLKVWGTGSPIREWLFINDVGKIVLQAIEEKNLPEYFNLSQEYGLSIRDTVKLLSNILDFDFNEVTFLTDMPDGDYKKILSSRIFKKFFNFKFTQLEEGLSKTIKYYKDILL
jgi:GDP-L-fucose synthase